MCQKANKKWQQKLNACVVVIRLKYTRHIFNFCILKYIFIVIIVVIFNTLFIKPLLYDLFGYYSLILYSLSQLLRMQLIKSSKQTKSNAMPLYTNKHTRTHYLHANLQYKHWYKMQSNQRKDQSAQYTYMYICMYAYK